MSEYSRRDFGRLTMAAVGGLTLATSIKGAAAESHTEKKATKQETHACRGLNSCKGNGGCGETKGKNECAGMGACATAEHHGCAGGNACKNQGGCGEKPGENACKGKGSCSVPLEDDAWAKARKNFEERMKKAGKKFGAAPAPAPAK